MTPIPQKSSPVPKLPKVDLRGEDHLLQAGVVSALENDPAIDAANIGVSVNDGAVTLSGTVDSWPEKAAATAATKQVPGVRVIADELDVQTFGTRTDNELARAAEFALNRSPDVPEDGITVVVRNGSVTLDGSVPWEFERRVAESIVRLLPGVGNVRNRLTLSATPIQRDVAARVQEAIVSLATVEAEHLMITVTDDEVHLRGRVHSFAERDAAERAAASSVGVARVHNRLHVGSVW